jgi:hypothetical protein
MFSSLVVEALARALRYERNLFGKAAALEKGCCRRSG